MSGVDVCANRFSLAVNRYSVPKSASVTAFLNQVMISNGLFEEANK